jgi:Cytochrome bd-type quinol oxidase, subunit 2
LSFVLNPKERIVIFWNYSFHCGSLCAAFFQGVILGAFVRGVETEGYTFTGNSFDWLSGFSIMTGIALVFGYALLGATWTIMKTEGKTQEWARTCAFYSLPYVLLFMGLVSLWVPFLSDKIFHRWFSFPNLVYLSPIPFLTLFVSLSLVYSLLKRREVFPFLLTILSFFIGIYWTCCQFMALDCSLSSLFMGCCG